MITISVPCWYNAYIVDNFFTGSPGDAGVSYMVPGLSTHSTLLGSASCLGSLFSALAHFDSYSDSFSSVGGNRQIFSVLFFSWAFLNEQVIDVSEDLLATLSYRCISTYLAAFHNVSVLILREGSSSPSFCEHLGVSRFMFVTGCFPLMVGWSISVLNSWALLVISAMLNPLSGLTQGSWSPYMYLTKGNKESHPCPLFGHQGTALANGSPRMA